MVHSLLSDESGSPGPDDFARAAGKARGLWDELTRRLDEMGSHGEPRWGGRKYGWELRFVRAGKPFTTLTPQKDGFVALVILGRDQAEGAESLTLGDRTRRSFDAASQLRDGRWLFLQIQTRKDLADVLALLELKLPKRARAAMAT